MNKVYKYFNRKRVLVTGGAGFIGSHLVQALVDSGAHVTILDNFSTGKIENLRSIIHKIEIIVGDIRSEKKCSQAVSNKSHIFHLAAMVSVPESTNNPEFCHDVNFVGTQTLFEKAASRKNPPSIIFSSSSAVYGNKESSCSETSKLNPQSPYATSKLEGELICKNYSETAKKRTVCLRYFNVHGPRQHATGSYSGVVAKFRQSLMDGKEVVIFGDGNQTRDFIHVKDVVRANMATAMVENPNFEIFNVGTGNSISLLKLLKTLENEVGKSAIKINFKEARTGDILNSLSDCKKYQSFLNDKYLKP
jgi:UDP-glucose 4-epimerase